MQSHTKARWLLSACGVATLFYCLLVLGFVGTGPDLGFRFLLVDNPHQSGPVIQYVAPNLKPKGDVRKCPQVGDILVALGPTHLPGLRLQPISTFVHFTHQLVTLRGRIPDGGDLPPGSDPTELADFEKIPPLVDVRGDELNPHQRIVQVEFLRPVHGGDPQPISTWLPVNSMPVGDLALSFVWFLFELAIFSVGALAFWTRPFDRPARLFFAMCIVTMGAFVGGYHWWVIAGNLWLNIPFCVCALLAPVVTLHFFLVYPHPKPPLVKHPRLLLGALYFPAMVAIPLFITVMCYCAWLHAQNASAESILNTLELLRFCIYAYFGFAALCFLTTLIALVHSVITTRNPIEHSQVKWILWAGVLSTVPVGYTLYLATFHRVDFAVGWGSVPMFIASLLFMAAYAVGIVRFKLMLVDRSREMLYFVVTIGATAVYSLTIALGSLIGIYQDIRSSYQALVVAIVLMVAVVLLSWLRERFQQVIDLKFFREKYQLDKALHSMNPTIGNLAEPEVLAGRMLASCRDVLLVDRAALYLRAAESEVFELVAAEGGGNPPLQFSATEQLLSSLLEVNSLQRVSASSREANTPVQTLLRQLRTDLIHALEIEGVIAGLVLLGPKRNGAPYSAEDLTFLTAMGQVTSVALHSAKVHRVVAGLNQELRLKMDKIGEQQRQISMLQAEITGRQETIAPSESEPFRCDLIKGSSQSIQQVLDTVRKVSGSHSSVLLRGESGTGKELLARAIHENSPRRKGPMISVHCGSLAASLLESELFGHSKGAFTGAHRDKPGRFEMANGGTLFLDEIGDISLETQIKLLRVLQERAFEAVGGTKTLRVDVRVIAATHQNLERLIAEGKFREDLYYRLNVISIALPPLRERKDDIFELALSFVTRAAERVGKRITHIDEEAVEVLKRYPWPGNIRELENAIERAIVLAEHEVITVRDLPAEFLNPRPLHSAITASAGERGGEQRFVQTNGGPSRKRRAAELERERLVGALQQTGGNKAEAARLLDMPRSTFFSKLKKHALD